MSLIDALANFVALALATLGGRGVVALALRRIDRAATEESQAGPWIGVLERLLVFQLAGAGQWSAIGWVLTAKSIARFKELEDRCFAEHYLVGTLASFAWALGVVQLRELVAAALHAGSQ